MSQIRPLTPKECVDLLAATPIGRLAFSEDALPAIHPVNFFLHRGDIIVRAGGTGALDRLGHTVVALQADRIDKNSHIGWSVVAVGKATAIAAVDGPADLAPGARTRFLRIPIEIITGRLVRLIDDDPGAAAS
ncbi:pyridoxamine 5'-phosphate oxidase family protein [Amycolatopsis acidicola]|uniref:Pyridoxamine 5'-phosphate oxidase family protein n=1 Tax=Amycolatopsis acidicola TaxID=2596893 RepID=A0A5N0V2D6_9PSEU|nr:pyridoxamine 5'-phosphate oxidase family protein [Amycolatopsis acidicola]KAA9157457.1 pyridoxamine 5'-phosphate oxidase family protein [Amycolatopsis acidicola]